MIATIYVVVDNNTVLGAYLEKYRAELHQEQVGGLQSTLGPVTVSEVEIELPDWMCG